MLAVLDLQTATREHMISQDPLECSENDRHWFFTIQMPVVAHYVSKSFASSLQAVCYLICSYNIIETSETEESFYNIIETLRAF